MKIFKKTTKEVVCPVGEELFNKIVDTARTLVECGRCDSLLRGCLLLISKNQMQSLLELRFFGYEDVVRDIEAENFMGMPIVLVDNWLKSGILDTATNIFVPLFDMRDFDKYKEVKIGGKK